MEVDSMDNEQPPKTDLETHGERVKQLSKKALAKGDKWYIVNANWMRAWEEYVGQGSNGKTEAVGTETAHPGPISNSILFKDDIGAGNRQLRENIVDEYDYELVPEEAWKDLKERFSLDRPEDEIERNVIESGLYNNSAVVELRPLNLNVAIANAESEAQPLEISRASSFVTLLKRAKAGLEMNDDQELRLYLKHEDGHYEQLDLMRIHKQKSSLQDFLSPGQLLVFDVQDEEGNWRLDSNQTTDASPSSSNQSAIPLPPPPVNLSESGESSGLGNSLFGKNSNSLTLRSGKYYDKGSSSSFGSKETVAAGLCGLQNLGNTCFMNSALQCLSNCPQLTKYFLDKRYEEEINESNILGMQGRLANAYAELIQKMWSGNYGSVIPRDFKWVVGQFAPQFSGYHQQDSQELMSFLLDGLHEDLNRIIKKPYIELKESDGRNDEVVAAESWNDYKQRNDSVITDCFHGQLKSTLVCPECNKVSVKFDPFCYLSLPLPANQRSIQILFVPADPLKKWVKYAIVVPKHGRISHLQAALEKRTGVSAKKTVILDISQHRVFKHYQDHDSISQILERDDVFAYELEEEQSDEPPVVVCVYQRYERKYGGMSMYSSASLDGVPLLFKSDPKDLTHEKLYQKIKAKMQTCLATLPDDDAFWWQEDGEDSGVEENGGGVSPKLEEPNTCSTISSTTETMDVTPSSSSDGDAAHVTSKVESMDGKGEDVGVGRRPFFHLSLINSYGSKTISELKPNDPEPVDSSKAFGVGEHKLLYVGVDWDSLAYEKLFNKEFASDYDEDESMQVKQKRVVTLDQCLNLFTTQEKLGENDLWYCPNCKDFRQATKQMDLWSLPQILIVHLKRFSYTKYWRDKIEDLVQFPIKSLDMSPWLPKHVKSSPPAIYDLIAVSNHMGGLGGGHYTAYALNDQQKKWYHFDDSFVGAASEDDPVSKSAYVLFYLRRDRVEEPNIEMETSD